MNSLQSPKTAALVTETKQMAQRCLANRNTLRAAVFITFVCLQFSIQLRFATPTDTSAFSNESSSTSSSPQSQRRNLESSCQALIDNQPSPDLWDDISKAVTIKENRFNVARMGKTHTVVFKGGLITVLKLANSWSSSNRTKQSRYGFLHNHGISPTSKYNCSFWKDRKGRTPRQYGEEGKNLLNEFFVYQVDRVLGFNTVPEGKLVAINPDVWQKHFSTAVCASPSEMKQHMDQLVKQQGDLRLLGWLQYFVEVTHYNGVKDSFNGTNIGENKCGFVEANSSSPVVYNTLDPEAVMKYYKFVLVMKLSQRADAPTNCFFARHLKNPVANCRDDVTPFYTPINLDNDRFGGSKPWKHPCVVPNELQERILGISNFTKAVLDSIQQDGQDLLGREDMKYFDKLITRSQAMFTELQDQFKDCQKNLPVVS